MRRNSRWSGFVGTDGSHHGIAWNSEGAFRAFDGKGGAIRCAIARYGRAPLPRASRQVPAAIGRLTHQATRETRWSVYRKAVRRIEKDRR